MSKPTPRRKHCVCEWITTIIQSTWDGLGQAPSPGMIKMILPSYLHCCPVTQAAILRNKMVFLGKVGPLKDTKVCGTVDYRSCNKLNSFDSTREWPWANLWHFMENGWVLQSGKSCCVLAHWIFFAIALHFFSDTPEKYNTPVCVFIAGKYSFVVGVLCSRYLQREGVLFTDRSINDLAFLIQKEVIWLEFLTFFD